METPLDIKLHLQCLFELHATARKKKKKNSKFSTKESSLISLNSIGRRVLTFKQEFTFCYQDVANRLCWPFSQISLTWKQCEYQRPYEVNTIIWGQNRYTEWSKNSHQTRVYLLQILACTLQFDISGIEEIKNG